MMDARYEGRAADYRVHALRLAQELVALCSDCSVTVATAESCTAGMVASTIAGVPGASDVLRGGAVTYVNEVKHDLLGVSQEVLDSVGAVSFACACQMAESARHVFGSSLAVSITGFAGPGGGTAEDPVGTVYIGIASRDGSRAERCHFEGDRDDVRAAACRRACECLLSAAHELQASGTVSFSFFDA